jgi:hypothetical protein
VPPSDNDDNGAAPPSAPPPSPGNSDFAGTTTSNAAPATTTDDGTGVPASAVVAKLDADYTGFGVIVLKLAFVALLGLAVCVAATGIVIAVALGFKGLSGRTQH